MGSFLLKNRLSNTSIMIESEFIDKYMAKANGEYVKVYLLLLRHLNYPASSLSISEIADSLDLTEKDIIRALQYWERNGLLTLNYDSKRTICGLEMGTLCPEEPKSIQNIQNFKTRKEELKQLFFVAEQYLGKTLSQAEVEAISYFWDTLNLSADVIDYLIEYCVANNKKSIHYIQRVAFEWAEQKISTVEQAKAHTASYNKAFYSILNAYGITGRAPAVIEVEYMTRWTKEYHISLDLILEACNRTIAKIHQPNFEYTDAILKNWLLHDVKTPADIYTLDAQHKSSTNKKNSGNEKVAANNKFHNFEERTYDMSELERKLFNH